jgi:V8-like Glu-specific endopeptidase
MVILAAGRRASRTFPEKRARMLTSREVLASLGVLAAVVLAAPLALAQVAAPPIEPPPVAGPFEPVGGGAEAAPIFRTGAGEIPAARPDHPDLRTIAAMPVPHTDIGPAMPSTDRRMTLYNAQTGEWVETPTVYMGEQPGFGLGGWRGPLPEVEQNVSDAFSNLTAATNLTSWPQAPNCKLVMRFRDQNGNLQWFVCSGTMIDAGVVLTAAHCVYARNPNGINIFNWAEIIYVYPAWDGVTPNNTGSGPDGDDVVENFGWASGTFFSAGTDYINNGNFDADVAMVRLSNRQPGQLTGWMGWWTDSTCTTSDRCNTRFFTNYAYPSETCAGALHNGQTMYVWSGCFDACSGNQGRINTTGGCFNAGWGGMSGSGAYLSSNNTLYVRGVSSNSNRSTSAQYCFVWNQLGNTDIPNFIAGTRGNTFDLQALKFRTNGQRTASIVGGRNLTGLSVFLGNTSNAARGLTPYTLRVYLSTNSTISSADTLLATWNYNLFFDAMGGATINIPDTYIPPSIASGTYWVGVILDQAADGNTSNNSTQTWDAVSLTVTQPPANDTCGGAVPLTLGGPLGWGYTQFANAEGSSTCDAGAAPDMYFSFTATCDHRYTISTCTGQTGFDTIVSLHSGCPATSANTIVCNDDDLSCGYNRSSTITRRMTAGETVYIRVTGYNGASGYFQLSVYDADQGFPSNTTAENALAVGDGPTTFDNCGAGTELAAPGGCSGSQIYNDLWYLYTPAVDATVTLSTCGESTMDTMIAVYDGAVNPPADGSAVACNDDACSLQSEVSFSATGGVPYLIRLGTYREVAGGAGNLIISSVPVVTPCVADYNRDVVLNLDDLGDYITDFYMEQPIPGGAQASAPTYADIDVGFGVPCAVAADAAPPYDLEAYRTWGYRVGFSIDGSNACPFDPEQLFPNLDNLSDYITQYYATFEAGGC